MKRTGLAPSGDEEMEDGYVPRDGRSELARTTLDEGGPIALDAS